MELSQVNLIVADLSVAGGFYETVFGARFRTIDTPDGVVALAAQQPVPLTVHTAGFASWWDPASPGVSPGATVLDLDVTAAEQSRVIDLVGPAGGAVSAPPQDMPWGQRYAVILDPDGYRWGLKAPLDA